MSIGKGYGAVRDSVIAKKKNIYSKTNSQDKD